MITCDPEYDKWAEGRMLSGEKVYVRESYKPKDTNFNREGF